MQYHPLQSKTVENDFLNNSYRLKSFLIVSYSSLKTLACSCIPLLFVLKYV